MTLNVSSLYEFFLKSNFFQLVAMLVCIAVVVCFFIKKYASGKDIDDSEKKIQKLHTFYIAGILVFIIIELVTAICMGGSSSSMILSYVNFAATLSSLIMSVVAIIFTIVSGNRGDEQYKKIDNASDRVTDSLNKFSEKTAEIDNSVISFRTISHELSVKMDSLLKEMGSVHNEVSDLKKQVEPQEQMISVVADNKKERDAQNEAIKVVASRIVAIGSYTGNLALYACVCAKDSGKSSFSISSITSQENVNYVFGYLVAAVAVGIIQGQISPDSCDITGYVDNLKQLVLDALEAFINKQTDENAKKLLMQSKQQIDDLFKQNT